MPITRPQLPSLEAAQPLTQARLRTLVRGEGRLVNLGNFKTAEAAHQAYAAAVKQFHGEFARVD